MEFRDKIYEGSHETGVSESCNLIDHNENAKEVMSVSNAGIDVTYFSDGTMYHGLYGWNRFAPREKESEIMRICNISKIVNLLSIAVIAIGCIFLYQEDTLGTFFVAGGVLPLFASSSIKRVKLLSMEDEEEKK